jgi:hypothetical protein
MSADPGCRKLLAAISIAFGIVVAVGLVLSGLSFQAARRRVKHARI